MKKMLRVLWLLPLMVYFSAITVNTNQFALVTNQFNNQVRVYQAGVHFILPLLESVYYIGATSHTELYSQPQTNVVSNGGVVESVVVTYLVNWQVTNPLQYYQLQQNNTSVSLAISNRIREIALVSNESELRTNATSPQLALGQSLLAAPLNVTNLGVRLNQLLVIAIALNNQPQKIAEKATYSSGSNGSLVLESAYYEANQIINQTALEKAQILANLPKSNRKFYDYFRRLEAYRENPLCIKELPPFNQIYLP